MRVGKESKPDAWMPLYIGDWDGDTGHLDCEQDGAYGRLIRHYWRTGPLPNDDAALARIVRMDLRKWKKVRPVLIGFFAISGSKLTHKRVDSELVRWSEKKVAAVERARVAADARWGKGNARRMPKALLEECPSPSSREVEGPNSPSTLSGADPKLIMGSKDFDPVAIRAQIDAELAVMTQAKEMPDV
jgi:uncharacterized protein YdaU (DUF1376 family)